MREAGERRLNAMNRNLEELIERIPEIIYDDREPYEIGFDFLAHDRRVDLCELSESEQALISAYRKALVNLTHVYENFLHERDMTIRVITEKMLQVDNLPDKELLEQLKEQEEIKQELIEIVMERLHGAPEIIKNLSIKDEE
jgi:hypothetical protein